MSVHRHVQRATSGSLVHLGPTATSWAGRCLPAQPRLQAGRQEAPTCQHGQLVHAASLPCPLPSQQIAQLHACRNKAPTCQRGQLVHARRIAVAGVQQQQAAQVLGAREALQGRCGQVWKVQVRSGVQQQRRRQAVQGFGAREAPLGLAFVEGAGQLKAASAIGRQAMATCQEACRRISKHSRDSNNIQHFIACLSSNDQAPPAAPGPACRL